ncbi:MAG TPA: DUF4350 domain-containing protein [Microbacterium sp.]|nr:DUF4350 domain-containing protein [Microbacterium sp.]
MSLLATTERPARPRGSRRRRIVTWCVLATVALAATLAVVALEREWTAPDPLDAESPRYDGARAVTTLLGERGVDVETAGDLDAARDGAERGATLVVTDASLVETEALRDLARTAPDVVILDGDFAALDALFPGIGFGGHGSGEPVSPSCALPVAENAGDIVPGASYSVAGDDVTGCYPVGEGHAVLQTTIGGSTVTLLDGVEILANDALATEGHAALALGLLEQHDELVWYAPGPGDAGADAAPTIADLAPGWVTPAIVLAALVALASAVWRGRRFGPLVAESLPVTVRAGETLEGRARLYRDGGDPNHALRTLRRGASARLAQRVGLSTDADTEQLARAVAAALGRDPHEVHAVLTAEAQTDADLADLGARLRNLESALDSTDPWEGRSR